MDKGTRSPKICESCGCNLTIEELRKRHPGALSCCPERKMVDGVWCQHILEVCQGRQCIEEHGCAFDTRLS